MKSANELVREAKFVAARGPVWTQGAGGNVSLKRDGQITIKASGLRLDELTPDFGFVSRPLEKLQSDLNAVRTEVEYASALAPDSAGALRPSMETGFHAALERVWVIHFHSCESILMSELRISQSKEFEEKVQPLIERSGLRFAWLPPIMPGWALTQSLASTPVSDIYILQNHGVILHSETPDILVQWEQFCDQFCRAYGCEQLIDYRKSFRTLTAVDVGGEAASDFKIYFPDAAVFASAIRAMLNETNKSKSQSKDISEIILATRWLQEACPSLSEWPAEFTNQIGALPTELARLAQRKGAKKD